MNLSRSALFPAGRSTVECNSVLPTSDRVLLKQWVGVLPHCSPAATMAVRSNVLDGAYRRTSPWVQRRHCVQKRPLPHHRPRQWKPTIAPLNPAKWRVPQMIPSRRESKSLAGPKRSKRSSAGLDSPHTPKPGSTKISIQYTSRQETESPPASPRFPQENAPEESRKTGTAPPNANKSGVNAVRWRCTEFRG